MFRHPFFNHLFIPFLIFRVFVERHETCVPYVGSPLPELEQFFRVISPPLLPYFGVSRFSFRRGKLNSKLLEHIWWEPVVSHEFQFSPSCSFGTVLARFVAKRMIVLPGSR